MAGLLDQLPAHPLLQVVDHLLDVNLCLLRGLLLRSSSHDLQPPGRLRCNENRCGQTDEVKLIASHERTMTCEVLTTPHCAASQSRCDLLGCQILLNWCWKVCPRLSLYDVDAI